MMMTLNFQGWSTVFFFKPADVLCLRWMSSWKWWVIVWCCVGVSHEPPFLFLTPTFQTFASLNPQIWKFQTLQTIHFLTPFYCLILDQILLESSHIYLFWNKLVQIYLIIWLNARLFSSSGLLGKFKLYIVETHQHQSTISDYTNWTHPKIII